MLNLFRLQVEDRINSCDRLRVIDGAAIALQLVYVRPWQPGDLVIRDNRSSWHSTTGELSRDERSVKDLTALNSNDPLHITSRSGELETWLLLDCPHQPESNKFSVKIDTKKTAKRIEFVSFWENRILDF